MRCPFCGSERKTRGELPACEMCLEAFRNRQVPAMDFKEYFSGGLERKLREVNILLSENEDNFFLLYLKGHLEHELGESKKALRSINGSIAAKEDFGDSWIRLGLIYSDLHRETDAVETFQKGLRYPLTDPSNLVDAGVSLIASEQPKLASDILERALDLIPEDDRALVSLAKVLFMNGKLDDARELLTKAVELYPHNEEVLRQMAQIMMKLGDLETSMEMYSRILDLHPRDFEALLAMGEINLKMGDISRAMKYYNAARDLDIHISWSGILKFIASSLNTLVNSNENIPSYRDELKKEFENIRLFMEEISEKVEVSGDPELLDDIGSLIRVLGNMKISLKEQLESFIEVLGKFKVDDSFHHHLRDKVEEMELCLEEKRYFDGKEIALELAPFLSDLKTMDRRSEQRLLKEIEERLGELEEVGLGNEELVSRLNEVKKLEKKGDLKGASFKLKEIQMALEEYWNDAGKRFFEDKLVEMERLLRNGEGRFDTSRLKRKLDEYRKSFVRGPRIILEGYLEFTRTYSEDSEAYYRKEVENTLKEIEYKLVILEKEGHNVRSWKRKMRGAEKKVGSEKGSAELYKIVSGFLEEISELERKVHVEEMEKRVNSLNELLEDIESIGLDEEIARNVEPVRRVIERSLASGNLHLAETLLGEVNENVERLLIENYLEDLKESLYDSVSEVERLRELGVSVDHWNELLESARSTLEDKDVKGRLIPAVSSLAELQNLIQEFYVEKLSPEIDRRISILKDLLKEGEGFEFDLSWDRRVVNELEERSSEISSLEILEEASQLEAEMERKIRDLLTEKIIDHDSGIRMEVERLLDMGGTQKEMMEVLSLANRAEVLLETGSERDAYRSIRKASEELQRIRDDILKRSFNSLKDYINTLLSSAESCGIDMRPLPKGYKRLLKTSKGAVTEEHLKKVKKLRDTLLDRFSQGMLSLFDEYDSLADDLIKQMDGLFPEEEIESIREQMARLEDAVRSRDLASIPVEFGKTEKLLDEARERATERAYLTRCSQIVESVISFQDEKAKAIVKDVQDLAKRIKKGETKGCGKEMASLEGRLSEFLSIKQIQNIEEILSDISELDDLFGELLEEIGDPEFQERIDGIGKELKQLLDSTSGLYESQDPEKIESSSKIVRELKERILGLESIWRAKKRLKSLEEMGAFDMEFPDRLLQRDLLSLRKLYQEEDHQRFFRVWERVEGQMDKIKRQTTIARTGGGTMDEGMEILVRRRARKGETPPGRAPRGRMGGIQRLGLDLAQKKRMLDGDDTEDPASSVDSKKTPQSGRGRTHGTLGRKSEKRRNEKGKKDENLVGVARLIAGERIRKMEEKDSINKGRNVDDGGKGVERLPWSKSSELDMENISGIMDEAIEMDRTSQKSVSPEQSAKNAKKKLETFYGKLPKNLRLDESMSFYGRGLAHLQRGDHPGALREFRLAISSAVKVTKLHMEITRALLSIDRELSKRRKRGMADREMESLFNKAEESFMNGQLARCAKFIKAIKKDLFNE